MMEIDCMWYIGPAFFAGFCVAIIVFYLWLTRWATFNLEDEEIPNGDV